MCKNSKLNDGNDVSVGIFSNGRTNYGEFALDQRLPPERELCEQLGLARSELRKAFAVLESEGAIWRYVGKGTFVGNGHGEGKDMQSLSRIAKRTTPQQVMRAGIVMEPQLAREMIKVYLLQEWPRSCCIKLVWTQHLAATRRK